MNWKNAIFVIECASKKLPQKDNMAAVTPLSYLIKTCIMFNNWEEKSKGLSISKRLLWEYDPSKIDWLRMKYIVVTRIIERGWMNDFYAAIRLYGGLENFKQIIREVPFLTDKDIDFVCKIFGLKKEELLCYTRKQLRKKHLSS